MSVLQASSHQGYKKFWGSGKQCLANSVTAVLHLYGSKPTSWDTESLDKILLDGHLLYKRIMTLSSTHEFLTIEDIPENVAYFPQSVHGLFSTGPNVEGTIQLENGLSEIFSSGTFGCVLTMGSSNPCYSSAVLKSADKYYFFDSHSRDEHGMCVPDGKCTMTSHQDIKTLCNFIRHLALSLKLKDMIQFELSEVGVNVQTCPSDSSESSFSGFSEVSDGEYTCRLYLAHNRSDNEYSSPISSAIVEDDYGSDEINGDLIENAMKDLDDSGTYLNAIDVDKLINEESESEYLSDVNSNDSDPDYNPDEESSETEEDDYLPLIQLKNKIRSKKTKSSLFDHRDDRAYDRLDNAGDRVDRAGDRVDRTGDRVDSTGDRVDGTGDRVDGTGDRVDRTGDRVDRTDDRVDGTGDRVDRTGDRVDRTGDRVDRTGDRVDRTGDRVDRTGDRVDRTGDRVDGTGDRVDGTGDRVDRTGDRVDRTGDRVDGTGDRVDGTGDRVDSTGDRVDRTGDRVDRTGDRVDGTGDTVDRTGDRVDRTGDRVDGTDDRVHDRVDIEDRENRECIGETVDDIDVEMDVLRNDGTNDKRGRKRIRNPEEWSRNVRKRRRNTGLSYVSGFSKKQMNAREIKDGCGMKCRFGCKIFFSNDDRKNVFHGFWSLGDIEKQRQFLLKYVCKIEKKSHKANSSDRRKNTFYWTLPQSNTDKTFKVCKNFFLATLSISAQRVFTSFYKQDSVRINENDKRGTHSNRPNRLSREQLLNVESHIKSFNIVESHYCRKSTSKKYLPCNLNVKKMYEMFQTHCSQNDLECVSEKMYRNIFNTNFNLSFQRPIKDRCDFCVSYSMSSDQEKDNLKESFNKHLKNKEAARLQKSQDKTKATNDKDGPFIAACFDLEQVLMTPHSFESSLFYKRRLSTYNFTIYNLGDKEGFCFVWNEAISGRGSCEVASCLYLFFKEYASKGKKDFVFFSDNCCGQNKNRYILSLYWYCLNYFNLKSVTHNFLEKGHTQSENDSIHATIEKSSKKISIYTTSQWSATIRTARRKSPYNVKEMNFRDFYDFKKVSENLKNFSLNEENEKVQWNSIKVLKMESDIPNIFQYKTDYDGTWHTVDLLKRSRSVVNPRSINLENIHKDGVLISRAKFADLVSLCRSNIIPSVHHPFYLLLPHE